MCILTIPYTIHTIVSTSNVYILRMNNNFNCIQSFDWHGRSVLEICGEEDNRHCGDGGLGSMNTVAANRELPKSH